PIPLAPPVTNATLPSNLNTLFITSSPFLSPRGSPHRNLFRCSSGRNRGTPRGERSLEILCEKLRQLIERDDVHLIVEVHVVRARNYHEFFRLGCGRVRCLAEVTRVRLFAMNQKHWPR